MTDRFEAMERLASGEPPLFCFHCKRDLSEDESLLATEDGDLFCHDDKAPARSPCSIMAVLETGRVVSGNVVPVKEYVDAIKSELY